MITEENADVYANTLLSKDLCMFDNKLDNITDYCIDLAKNSAPRSMIEHVILTYASNYAEFMVNCFALFTQTENTASIYRLIKKCEDITIKDGKVIFNVGVRYVHLLSKDWVQFCKDKGIEKDDYIKNQHVDLTLEEVKKYKMI